jgi:hypothetical protein
VVLQRRIRLSASGSRHQIQLQTDEPEAAIRPIVYPVATYEWMSSEQSKRFLLIRNGGLGPALSVEGVIEWSNPPVSPILKPPSGLQGAGARRDGHEYTLDQIRDHVWPKPDDELYPDTRYVYTARKHGMGHFDPVSENPNPLVGSDRGQLAVETMRERGLTYRQIARTCGVSIEAVHRPASGVGRIRLSTEEALVAVAGRLNGKRPSVAERKLVVASG